MSRTVPACQATARTTPPEFDTKPLETPAISPVAFIANAVLPLPVGAKSAKDNLCPFLQSTALPRAFLLEIAPTISPLSFTPWAELVSPDVPRSDMLPWSQRNACVSPLIVLDSPTTCPTLLMAFARLKSPPSVPRSTIAPFSQRNAWLAEVPTT